VPQHAWSFELADLQSALNTWAPTEGGYFFISAIWTVDSLHYLADLDAAIPARPAALVGGHDAMVVDIAHARWATGSAITALDLCAGALARRCHLPQRPYEYDLRDLGSSGSGPIRSGRSFSHLTPAAQRWVSDVEADADYSRILHLRYPLVHAHLRRHVSLELVVGKGVRGSRTAFVRRNEADSNAISTPLAVTLARDVATRHVEALAMLVLSSEL
jgi:hypothetical protein